MADKKLDEHRDHLVERHRAGATAGELAAEFGVSHKVVVRILGAEYQPGRYRLLDDAAVVAAYLSGMSENAVAAKFGIGRNMVTRRLAQAGVHHRGRSEAEYLKWSQMTPEQKAAQVKAANDAARGRVKSLEEKCMAARTREVRPVNVSEYELALLNLLANRGLRCGTQTAVGPYNCDLTAPPVAVEVWGGNWHFGGDHAARTPERIRHLLDAGWHVLIVVVNRQFPITPAVADYVLAYVKQARRNPAAGREYRMVWGAGEFTSGGRADDDHVPDVMTLCRRRQPAAGQDADEAG